MIKVFGLMLLFVWGMSHSIQFMHTVKPKEEFCMYQTFHHHSRFTFEIEPANDTSYEFTSIISLSYSTPYYHQITEHGREKIKMSRMVPTTNKYTFCVINHGIQESFFKIKLAQGAQVMDFSAGPSKKDHQFLDMGVDSIETLTKQLEQSITDTEINRVRAQVNLQTIITRAFYICILSIAVVIGTNTLLYKTLRDLVLKRKRM